MLARSQLDERATVCRSRAARHRAHKRWLLARCWSRLPSAVSEQRAATARQIRRRTALHWQRQRRARTVTHTPLKSQRRRQWQRMSYANAHLAAATPPALAIALTTITFTSAARLRRRQWRRRLSLSVCLSQNHFSTTCCLSCPRCVLCVCVCYKVKQFN